jgi:hypothetical protein
MQIVAVAVMMAASTGSDIGFLVYERNASMAGAAARLGGCRGVRNWETDHRVSGVPCFSKHRLMMRLIHVR